jgi:hypothetical protein
LTIRISPTRDDVSMAGPGRFSAPATSSVIMTPSIVVSSVCADLLILLALGVAAARPAMPELTRLVISTVAFASAWLITAAFEALRAPGWTIFLGGAVIVVSIAAITATLHVWTQGGDGGESAPGHRGAHGGGGPRRRRPDAPLNGGGGSDPSWWPEFERQLGVYVAEREKEGRPVRGDATASVT